MLAERASASPLDIETAAACVLNQPWWLVAAGWACGIWYAVVVGVCTLGWIQLSVLRNDDLLFFSQNFFLPLPRPQGNA